MKSDIDIAQEATLQPITDIANSIDLNYNELVPYGKYIAKVPINILESFNKKKNGKLILVTAMTPTPQGEGKTTNTIGIGQALQKIGKKSFIAIREPSLGPCMGLKGGAAGGGYSQVLPMEDINLHFTGDIHAVSIAHNLLSAVIDNQIHQNNDPEINARKIIWKRVIDMNDRSLRNILVGLEGRGLNGVIREDGFEITAASEIMAILCLSNDLKDLKEKIGNILIGYDSLKKPIKVKDIGVQGAMTALLKNAINPNLVQSIEGVPALVHGGPFANIAHGCNSIVATKLALKLSDYTVTEAGFGADLGAEKFFNIKCRMGNLNPNAVVLVVTLRAFNMHGIDNIAKHVENIKHFNLPVVISINKFIDDDLSELKNIQKLCKEIGVDAIITDLREKGGEGGIEIAEKICKLCESENKFKTLYDAFSSIPDKIEIIAKRIYGAKSVEFTDEALKQIKQIENYNYANLPICMAKTPASLSDNPKLPGRPKDFIITVRSAKVSAGAGFIVIYTGNVMTMPGLPKKPAALDIDVDINGNISGLF